MPLQNLAVYDTNALVQVVQNLKVSQTFLLNNFFPNIVASDTEYVSIDVDIGKRRMAPFVSPLVEGKLVESRRFQTNTFKPAYIKDKRAPDLRKPIRRMIGERIGGGELTGAERMAANVQFEMEDQIDVLNRRLEWMAAQALLTGTVTITGDGFPSTLVDFGRDAALTVALTGTAMWDNAANTKNPTDNIEEWQNLILKKSGGVCTDIVFTVTPWNKFLSDDKVRQAIWYPGNGQGNTINIGSEIQRGAIFKGMWGQYRLWVYNDWYVDDATGQEKPMIPDGALVMTGSDLQGTQAFGSILDPKFNYGALPYAPKMWAQDDPAQLFLMMQSAPIVIPSRVNACLAATVTAAVVN
jgi:hypothetical protein